LAALDVERGYESLSTVDQTVIIGQSESMPYPYAVHIPERVARAHQRAIELGFPLMPEGRPIGEPAPTTAVTPMDGALLRSLAAGHRDAVIGEIGTGPGVSTAWLLSGMQGTARLVSCEIDEHLARSAGQFFADDPRVEILHGDWEEVLRDRGPFGLLFFDANAWAILADHQKWDVVLNLVRLGGQIVLDDLVPVDMWPDAWQGMTDYKREFCLCNERIAGVEVRTSARTVSLVGTRLR
jgi:predicted O-methyltransferase YrrM